MINLIKVMYIFISKMNSINIKKFNKVNWDYIQYSDPVKMGKNTDIYLNYMDKGNSDTLLLQFPNDMKIPFDINKTETEYKKKDEIITKTNYSITLNFNMTDSKHLKCLEKLENFDKKIKEAIFRHSFDWFNRTLSVDEIDKMYSNFLVYSKDRDTGVINKKFSSIRFQIPMKNDTFVTKVYMDRNKVDLLENLKKFSYITPIGRLNKIWASNTKIGTTWDLQLVKMTSEDKNKKPSGQYAFVDDDSD